MARKKRKEGDTGSRGKRRGTRSNQPTASNSSSAKSSRQEQFKRQQRKSWFWFLAKIAMFVVPIIGITTWMIIRLMSGGQSLPIMTLSYDGQPNRSELRCWHQINFSLASTDTFELPENEKVLFGGPENNVLFLFADVVADVRTVNGEEIPSVFVPYTDEQLKTQAYAGLRATETDTAASQWVAFETYLSMLIDGIRDNYESDSKGNIVFVLDVDHPDLPARLPPQQNQFIRLCEDQWEQSLSKTIADDFDVFVWLSHSPGQKSYVDSDPSKVESFFKRRFEMAITGDVLPKDWESTGRDWVSFRQLQSYLKRWVETDSAVHLLAQTPTFLQPEHFTDDQNFPVLEFEVRPETTDQCGKLFNYTQRTLNNQLDAHWATLDRLKVERHWDLENPLARQRATMLLLQMEKLWYLGFEQTVLFKDLESQLAGVGGIFNQVTTIDPVLHSLADAAESRSAPLPSPIDLKLLSNSVEGLDPESAEAKKELFRRADELKTWRQNHLDWRGAMSCWLALKDSRRFSRQQIVDVLTELKTNRNQTNPDHLESTSTLDLSDINWNEIAYLKRLQNELVWPEKERELAPFQSLVQVTLQIRHKANEFSSKMVPCLVNRFQGPLLELEEERRLCEDLLFANDTAALTTRLAQLDQRYQDLAGRYKVVREQYQAIEDDLLLAPHELKYVLESASVPEEYGDRTVANELEAWFFDEESGFADLWESLGNQMIGVVVDKPSEAVTEAFETHRRTIFEKQAADGTIDPTTQEKKRIATNAWLDQQWLSQQLRDKTGNVSFMNVADGNLLARRLLHWPGLSLDQRKQIRLGLSKPDSVDPSGEAERNYKFGQVATSQQIHKLMLDNDVAIRFRRDDNPVVYNTGNLSSDENYFIQLAYQAHRQLIESNVNDETSRQVTRAINDFHSRKSDLSFQRVAGDNWGSPKVGAQSFVAGSLSNHNFIITNRIETFQDSVRKDTVKEVWTSGPKQDWPAQLQRIEAFAKEFQLFRWIATDEIAKNETLAELLGAAPDQMVYALFPERKSTAVRPSTFDVQNAVLDTQAFKGKYVRNLNVYLRGHQMTMGVQAPQKSADPKTITVVPKMERVPSTRVIVKREEIGPSAGQVTLVIDCSDSMATSEISNDEKISRMDRLRDDVIDFLRDISLRSDISVSLVAIGASEKWVMQNKPAKDPRSADELSRWKKVAGTDVWHYRENGNRVTRDNVESLINAVKELKPYGDTPILEGVDSALGLTEGEEQNLVVLLTDGFEFNNRHRKPGQGYQFDPLGLYKKISNELMSAPKFEMVVFSYVPEVGENGTEQRTDFLSKFKGMIAQNFDADEIVRRVQKIERLADSNKVRHRRDNESGALKKFFDNLLPKPYVKAHDDKREFFREPIVYPKNEGLPVLEKQLGTERLPKGRWSIGVEYTEPKLAATGFAESPAPWNKGTKLAGNETLVFLYDPIRPSLQLTSGRLTGETQRVPFGEEENALDVVIKSIPSANKNTPAFAVVAADDNRLTPAPSLAVVEFRSGAEGQNRVLLQDFGLPQQTSSNVHQVKMPTLRDDHRRAAFGNDSVDMTLRLLRDVPPQLWSRIRFGEDERFVVSADQAKVTLPAADWGDVASLLPKNNVFNGYEFRLRRMNPQDETADFTLRIESDEKPVDRWLVNVVNESGAIDRYAVSKSQRRYTFTEDINGNRRLKRVEHDFTINLERLKERELFFGIAHIDELDGAATANYPEYFRAR
ncbi:MAG: hypothetical protein AAFN77_06000 [Planctomycetota bacterium]